MHHIASDGWSVGVFLQELSALYGSFIAEQGDPLAPLPLQYADYAAWQRRWLASGQLEKQGAFWQTNLSGAPTLLELPTDRPRPPKQSHAGASVEVKLGAALSERVKRLSQRHGVTPYMTLLSSWAAVLSRLSGQEEVVIGSPVAGRNRTEVEALIGFFVNTLALRLDLSSEPTVGELLKRTKAQVLSAQAHQDLPFDQVVERVKPPRSTAHPPLFQVMFVWQNMPAGELTIPGLTIRAVETPLQTAQFELTLSLRGGGRRHRRSPELRERAVRRIDGEALRDLLAPFAGRHDSKGAERTRRSWACRCSTKPNASRWCTSGTQQSVTIRSSNAFISCSKRRWIANAGGDCADVRRRDD